MSADTASLLTTPLHDLHLELGARMVPFAGYHMPVQYPSGLMAEHHHTRTAAGLFDVSHMGQLRLVGSHAAQAFEQLMPVDVMGLGLHKQRYGLLLNDEGGILDDLMFVNRDVAHGGDLFVIVNGACKHADLAHIQSRIGGLCTVEAQFDRALLALQGPQAVTALARVLPGVERLVFMTGMPAQWQGADLYVTRSGYTGEDGFEISLPAAVADLRRRLPVFVARVRRHVNRALFEIPPILADIVQERALSAVHADRGVPAANDAQAARAEVSRCGGSQFDQRCAEAFLAIPPVPRYASITCGEVATCSNEPSRKLRVGRMPAALSPKWSSRNSAEPVGATITGMRSWMVASSAFGAIVISVAVSSSEPSAPIQCSHNPAKANNPSSARWMK